MIEAKPEMRGSWIVFPCQVMRRLGLTEAFTNDQHFQAAGFTTLF